MWQQSDAIFKTPTFDAKSATARSTVSSAPLIRTVTSVLRSVSEVTRSRNWLISFHRVRLVRVRPTPMPRVAT